MTTQLEHAQAALAAADERLRTAEHHFHELQQERAALVALGPGSDSAIPAYQRRLGLLDGEIASCGNAIRLSRAQAAEARERLSASEGAISVARGMIGNLQAAAAECERLAARARQEAALWESQRDQKLVELEQARTALAGLLGITVDQLDEQLVAPQTPPNEPAALAPNPRLVPSPRLVLEWGVRRWFDDLTGKECTIDGSPIASS